MVPSAECKRLYRFDKSLRFGIAHLQGRGRTIFVAKLIPRDKVGGDSMNNRAAMWFMPHDSPGFITIYDRKGRADGSYRDWDGNVPVLWGWPGQMYGNDAVVTGSYVSMLMYHGKPHYALEEERKAATAEAGRAKDRAIKEEAYEAYHYHKHLQGKYAFNGDKLTTKEDVRAELKKEENAEFLKVLENDSSTTFEAESLRNAGFE